MAVLQALRIRQSLVLCLAVEQYRKLWIYWEMASGIFRIRGMLRSTVDFSFMRQSTEPSLMAATCSVLYVALERLKCGFSGSCHPGLFPHSALICSTVDTVWRQFTSFGVFTYFST